ncbi:aldehyde dehydrogenase family protein [Bradyrhizobium brasilense]|uniref:aldehyde dehydrogenase family protein n=1 Tax=Bradyrhizobium brasilense TaxID=1419277 RepID=UPI003D31D705
MFRRGCFLSRSPAATPRPAPSQRAPSASLVLAQWLQEAGLPDGVFDVVHGDKRAAFIVERDTPGIPISMQRRRPRHMVSPFLRMP